MSNFNMTQDELESVLHWRGKHAQAVKERDAILMQARIWSGEAKTQRNTVNEIGSILGGIPDWGPVVAKVGGLLGRVNSAEAELDKARELLGKAVRFMAPGAVRSELEAYISHQSAPAAKPCSHIWVSADNRGAGDGEICQVCSVARPAAKGDADE